MLTRYPKHISGQCSHFILPGKTREPFAFLAFSGGNKMETVARDKLMGIKDSSRDKLHKRGIAFDF